MLTGDDCFDDNVRQGLMESWCLGKQESQHGRKTLALFRKESVEEKKNPSLKNAKRTLSGERN